MAFRVPAVLCLMLLSQPLNAFRRKADDNQDIEQAHGESSQSRKQSIATDEELNETLGQNGSENWFWNSGGGETDESCSKLFSSPEGNDSKGNPYSAEKSVSYSENGYCRCDDKSELFGDGCARKAVGVRKFGERVGNKVTRDHPGKCYCKHIPLECLAIKDWRRRGTDSCRARRGFADHTDRNNRRQFEAIGPCQDKTAKDKNGEFKCAKKDGWSGDGKTQPKIFLRAGEQRYINVFVKTECQENAPKCGDQKYRKIYPKDDPDRSGSGGRIYGHDIGGRNSNDRRRWFWR